MKEVHKREVAYPQGNAGRSMDQSIVGVQELRAEALLMMLMALGMVVTEALLKRMGAVIAVATAAALAQSLGMIGALLMMMIIMGPQEAANPIKSSLGYMLYFCSKL